MTIHQLLYRILVRTDSLDNILSLAGLKNMEMTDLLNIFENELYMKNHVEVSQANDVPINI